MILKTALIALLPLLDFANGDANDKTRQFFLVESEKYYPRNSNALAKRQDQSVFDNSNGNGVMMRDGSVRKMSGHEGEKLMLWISQGFSPADSLHAMETHGNNKASIGSFTPPMDADSEPSYEKDDSELKGGIARWLAIGRRSGLVKRETFTCPDNASSCSGIGKPLACCQNGSTCQIITDTGFGDVGCCEQGQQCSGGLDRCFEGYTKCDGGGCCRPGYYCTGGGCAPRGGPSVPFLTTRPTVATGLDICEKSYYPCPSSLSFGCCRIGRLCGITDCPLNTGPGTPGIEFLTGTPSNLVPASTVSSNSGTITIAPPTPESAPAASSMVQPTDSVKQTGAAGGVINISGSSCPTGYYSCGSEFNGGCCRTGRSCGVTSCPAGSTSSAGTTGPSCAPGYYSCPPSVNGGCCPSGYACAISNCPASSIIGPNGEIQTQATASAAAKATPSNAHRSKAPEMIFCVGIASFIAGVLALSTFI